MKPLNVLSLFNGISCGRLALERARIPVANYYESEIDPYAGKVSAYNWPQSVQIGDVRSVVVSKLPFVPDLIIAGSPCQGFSFAGKQLNFSDPRSALFFEFVRILKECQALNPDVLYMLENVPMKKCFQRVINEQLGIMPVEINAALVSAQNRVRLFWSNIRTRQSGLFGDVYTDIPQPEDKGIVLSDILEREVPEKYFLSERALARISQEMRRVNPDKTYAVTRNSETVSGGRKRQGTLIGCVNDNGHLREVEQSNCIDSNYAKGMDNHGQRTLAVVVQKKSFPERVYSESEKHGTVLCGSNGSGAHKNLVKTDLILQRNYAQCVSMRGRHIDETGKRVDIKGAETVQRIESAVCEGKTNCITTVQKDNLVSFNTSQIRRLTPTEVCRLFNVPDDYFHDKDGNRLISESQQYKALGNGWVVDVIAHIFSFIPDALAL